MLSRPTARQLQTGLIVVLVAWGALEGAGVLASGLELLLKQRPTCPTELYLLEGMQAVARGADLYPEVEGPPYVFRFYNPLSYALGGALLRVALGRSGRFDDALVLSRVPSFLCGLVLCALLAWYQQRRYDSTAVAALTLVVLLLLHSSSLSELTRNRPEMPALLVTLAGWIIAQRRPRGWRELAAACFVVAFLFKQSFLAAPAAVALQLLVAREHTHLKRFILALAVAGGAGLAWCIGAFGDDYFTHAVFTLASHPLDPAERLPHFAGLLVSYHWGPWFIVAFAFAATYLGRRRCERPLLIYTGVSLVWTTVISCKVGSCVNYYCELSVLLVLCLTSAIGELRARDARLLWAPLTCLLLFLSVNVVRHGPGWNQVCVDRARPQPRCDDARRPRRSSLARLEQRYRAHPAPTLYFDEELAVRMGRPVLLDYYTLYMLVQARYLGDLLDPARIEALIRSRRYRRLVFPQPGNPWTARWLAASIAAGYRPSLSSRRIVELTLR